MRKTTYAGPGFAAIAVMILACLGASAQASSFSVVLSDDSGDVVLDDCDSVHIGDLTIDIISEPDPANNKVIRKRPGRVKYSNLVLRVSPGTGSSKELQAWFQEAAKGKDVRKSISIVLKKAQGGLSVPSPEYTFFNGRLEEFFLTEKPSADGTSAIMENYELSTRGLHLDAGTATQSPRRMTAKIVEESTGLRLQEDCLTSWAGGEPVTATGALFGGTNYHEPSQRTFTTNLILKKAGEPGSAAFYEWINAAAGGEDQVRTLEISEIKPNGKPGRTYTYHECWPCRWKAPELNSNSDTYIVEELEFAVERVERG